MRVIFNGSIYTVIFIVIFIVIFVLILYFYMAILSIYIPDITISVPAFSYISAVSGEIPESVITILMSSSDA